MKVDSVASDTLAVRSSVSLTALAVSHYQHHFARNAVGAQSYLLRLSRFPFLFYSSLQQDPVSSEQPLWHWLCGPRTAEQFADNPRHYWIQPWGLRHLDLELFDHFQAVGAKDDPAFA